MTAPEAQAQIAVRGVSHASTVIASGTPTLHGNYQLKGENSSTSLTIAIPDFSSNNPGHNGDLLIAQITISGSQAVTAPTGWTLLNSTTTDTTNGKITQAIYWRLHAGANETQNHTWTWASNTEAAGGITLYSGVSMNNPFDAWTVGKTAGGTDFNIPTLTTLSNDTMLLAFLASAQNGSNHTVPQNVDGTGKMGMNPGNHDYDQNVQDDHRVRITFAAQPSFSANTTVSKVANHSSTVADNIAHLIALRPANADAAASALTISLPAGTVNSDVMIASILFSPCSSTDGGSCTSSITAPSGWTQVDTRSTITDADGGYDGYGSRLYVYQKVANNELASYTWNFSGVSAPRKIDAVGGIVSFSGVDTGSPVVVHGGQTNGSNRTQTAPSIDTGTVSNTMLLATLGIRSSGVFSSPSTGLTAHVNRASRSTPNSVGLTLGMYSSPFETAGSTGTKQATLSDTSSSPYTADTGMGHLLALRPAGTGPHHLEIQHSGTGVTCTSTTITVKACSNSDCSAEYTSGVSGTLTATGTPTVNWDGTTGGASGAGFVIAAGSGSVTKKVQVTTPGSVDFGVTGVSPAPSSAATCSTGSSTSCTFTAEEAGFLLDVPDHTSEVQQTLTIKAVKKSDSNLSCVPAFASVSKTINLKCAYVNPSSGTLPVRVAGSPLASSAASACSATGADISLAFDATGTATPALQYADVGEMKVDAAYAGTSGTEAGLSMVGNTQFIAAPASFAFSNITTGTIKAGTAFSVTLTAVNNIGAATPNFGKEATPEGVTLSANLVSPSPGNNPALSSGAIAGSVFSNGVASLSDLSWGEVGTVTLTARLTSTLANSGTYLGSGVTTQAPTSGNIGRFIPNHFDTVVSGGMACPAGLTCPTSGFVYSAQTFTTEIFARNASGGTTLNYDHARAHANEVTLSAWDAAGSTTDNNPNDGVMSGNTVAASEFLLGEATVSTAAYALPNAYPSATAPPAPTNIYMRATESAADGVTSLRGAASVEGGIAIASGRAFIRNAYGSELLRLPIDFIVQYWNGGNWVTSQTDSNSSFAPGDVDFINCTLNLVDATASDPANCKPVVQVASSPATISVANGKGKFVLNAPGSGNNGSADLRLGTPSYLPSTTARARFGINKGRLIYLREMY